MAKNIKIQNKTANNNFADTRFVEVQDKTPYTSVFAKALSGYQLVQFGEYITDITVSNNFFNAKEQMNDRLKMKSPSYSKCVGYATEAMIYHQILKSGSGLQTVYPAQSDNQIPEVQELKTVLETIIDQAKKICGPKVIKDVNDFIDRKFNTHQQNLHNAA